jgi:hypothetical protein
VRLRPWQLLIAAVALALLAATAYWALRPSPPALPAGSMAGLDVDLRATEGGQKAAKLTTDDPAKVEAVAGVLRRGRAVEDHKCESTGSLTFRLHDGSAAEFDLLAGHDRRYYEYRGPSGTFRVDRQALGRAMAGLGVGDLDTGLPDR